jgi:preprotein translocase subunit SecG
MILYGLVLIVHIVAALFLIAVVLLQGGRGGLGEAMGGAAAQSLFGGGANLVMTKITAVGAALFMTTCLSLAGLSTARGRSVIERLPAAVDELPLDGLPLDGFPLAGPAAVTPPRGGGDGEARGGPPPARVTPPENGGDGERQRARGGPPPARGPDTAPADAQPVSPAPQEQASPASDGP